MYLLNHCYYSCYFFFKFIQFYLDTANNITVRNVAINPEGNFDEICGYALQPNAFMGHLVVIFPPPAQPGDYMLLDTGTKIYL